MPSHIHTYTPGQVSLLAHASARRDVFDRGLPASACASVAWQLEVHDDGIARLKIKYGHAAGRYTYAAHVDLVTGEVLSV